MASFSFRGGNPRSVLRISVLFIVGCLLNPGLLFSQANAPVPAAGTNLQTQVASLREDVRLLDERMRRILLDMEALQRENQELRDRLARSERAMASAVTADQLRSAVEASAKATSDAEAARNRQLAAQLSQQIQDLARQTQEGFAALARGGAARPPATPPPSFANDFPRTGITYTVERGDTLSSIAARFGSSVRDIQNANQIANPRELQVGQVLFIPQRENS